MEQYFKSRIKVTVEIDSLDEGNFVKTFYAKSIGEADVELDLYKLMYTSEEMAITMVSNSIKIVRRQELSLYNKPRLDITKGVVFGIDMDGMYYIADEELNNVERLISKAFSF
ncbi:MAG: hypothetical protein KAH32_07985 [Chlamydiia bacterium]|nr:hypothetical protein [Chlamydiia bacterium]